MTEATTPESCAAEAATGRACSSRGSFSTNPPLLSSLRAGVRRRSVATGAGRRTAGGRGVNPQARRDASSPAERVDVDRATDAAVALGWEAFAGALGRGRRTSIEEAAGYALSGGTTG
jgi:hypothetical protein